MHMFIGAMQKGKRVDGFVHNGLVHLFHVCKRHDDLVTEMKQRGYNHKSPILPPKSLDPDKYLELYHVDNINIEANEAELRRRCKECKF